MLAVTLTDFEAERVFGALRREFQLDVLKFRSTKEIRQAVDDIMKAGRTANLGRTARGKIKEAGEEYFRRDYRRAHQNVSRRFRELGRRPNVIKTTIRGRVMISKRWTARDIENLRMLYPRQDETSKSIAFILGRTPKSVSRKAERLKLRKRRR